MAKNTAGSKLKTYYFYNDDDVLRSFQAKPWGKGGALLADRPINELAYQICIKYPDTWDISLDPAQALALRKEKLANIVQHAEARAAEAHIRARRFKENQTATQAPSYLHRQK